MPAENRDDDPLTLDPEELRRLDQVLHGKQQMRRDGVLEEAGGPGSQRQLSETTFGDHKPLRVARLAPLWTEFWRLAGTFKYADEALYYEWSEPFWWTRAWIAEFIVYQLTRIRKKHVDWHNPYFGPGPDPCDFTFYIEGKPHTVDIHARRLRELRKYFREGRQLKAPYPEHRFREAMPDFVLFTSVESDIINGHRWSRICLLGAQTGEALIDGYRTGDWEITKGHPQQVWLPMGAITGQKGHDTLRHLLEDTDPAPKKVRRAT